MNSNYSIWKREKGLVLVTCGTILNILTYIQIRNWEEENGYNGADNILKSNVQNFFISKKKKSTTRSWNLTQDKYKENQSHEFTVKLLTTNKQKGSYIRTFLFHQLAMWSWSDYPVFSPLSFLYILKTAT